MKAEEHIQAAEEPKVESKKPKKAKKKMSPADMVREMNKKKEEEEE